MAELVRAFGDIVDEAEGSREEVVVQDVVNEIERVLGNIVGLKECYNEEKMKFIQKRLDVTMTQLRSKLLLNSPFYGECLIRLGNYKLLSVEESIKYGIRTAATDGIRILFAPDFVDNLPIDQLSFVILHEMYHILMMHAERARNMNVKSYEHVMWNEACDYVINYLISAAIPEFETFDLKVKFAEGGLLKKDERGNLVDLSDVSAEDLFAELKSGDDDENQQSGSNGKSDKSESENGEGSGGGSKGENSEEEEEGNGSGDGSEGEDEEEGNGSGDGSEGEDEEEGNVNGSGDGSEGSYDDYGRGDYGDLRPDLADKFDDDLPNDHKEIKSMVEEVMKDIASKDYSDTPGYMKRKIELDLKKPKLRWDKYLRKFLSSKITDEVSYDKPDKRYLNHGMIMAGPGAEAEYINNLSIYFDTSGSISNDVLIKFLSHAWKIADDYECTMSLYFWHTDVYGEYRDIEPDEFLKAAADIDMQAGGTDIQCVLDFIRENDLKSTAYIVLTDGYFYVPKLDKLGKRLSKKTMLALLDTKEYDKELETLGKIVSLGEE